MTSVHTGAVLPRDVPLKRLLVVVVGVGMALMAAGLAANTEQLWIEQPELTTPAQEQVATDTDVTRATDDGEERTVVDTQSPIPEWVPVIFLVAILGVLMYLAGQHLPRLSVRAWRNHRLAPAKPNVETTDQVDDETVILAATNLIDDLSLEGDPRAAIQRAYAVVETGFGSRELARKPAETPLRYLQRVFGRHAEAADPLRQLTSLFEVARFSTQPVTEDMRSQAIDAVSQIRGHYRSRRRGRVR